MLRMCKQAHLYVQEAHLYASCVPASLSLFQVVSSYQGKKTGKRSQSGTNVISLNQVQSLKHQTTIFGGNYSDGINIALMWEGWVMYLKFSLIYLNGLTDVIWCFRNQPYDVKYGVMRVFGSTKMNYMYL